MTQPSMLDVNPSARRDEDFYATPAYQTRALLRRLRLRPGMRIFEPCCGDGAIVRELPSSVTVITNDIVERPPLLPDFLSDARRAASWDAFAACGRFDLVITNPPFNVAFEIAQQALARCSKLILLLRLSWLEPTDDRGEWLAAHPPSGLIVLPRYDYRGNGSTDSVTSAWVIWETAGDPIGITDEFGIDIVTKAERDADARR